MIRLIAIDMDGTLLSKDGTITASAVDALKQAFHKDIIITIATGRMFASALKYAEKLGIDAPLITYNGALVKSSVSQRIYGHWPVNLDDALKVLNVAKKHSIHTNIYLDDVLYVESMTKEAIDYAEMANVDAVPVGDFIPFLRGKTGPTKILGIGDPDKLKPLKTELINEFGNSLYLTGSLPHYMEVMSPGISKAKGLKSVACEFGIDKKQIMAIGDSFNDIDMIQYAGIGVAVANARDKVKEVADYVAKGQCGDGVKDAIEEYVLS